MARSIKRVTFSPATELVVHEVVEMDKDALTAYIREILGSPHGATRMNRSEDADLANK